MKSLAFLLPLLLPTLACDSTQSECEGEDCLVVGPQGPEGPKGPPGPALYINPETGIEYSLDASPCGVTLPYTGNVGGYSSAKGLCEDVDECGVGAHVCTSTELVRYVATGGEISVRGRHARGLTNGSAYDCRAFTRSGVSQSAAWDEMGATLVACNVELPLHCCD